MSLPENTKVLDNSSDSKSLLCKSNGSSDSLPEESNVLSEPLLSPNSDQISCYSAKINLNSDQISIDKWFVDLKSPKSSTSLHSLPAASTLLNPNSASTKSLHLNSASSPFNAALFKSDVSNTSTNQNMLLDTLVMEEINKNKWRNRHLHKHFLNEIPLDQICIADFTCALDVKGVLRQGRMYFTNQFVAFHSPIGSIKVLIHVSELDKIVPRNNLVFPTSIHVYTRSGTFYNFTSFIFRNNALNSFTVLMTGWSSIMDVQNRACSSTEETLLSDHEDEDSSKSFIEKEPIDKCCHLDCIDSCDHESNNASQVDEPTGATPVTPSELFTITPTKSSLHYSKPHHIPTQKSTTTKNIRHHHHKKPNRKSISNRQISLPCDLIFVSTLLCMGLMGLNLIIYLKSTGLILS